MTDNYDPGGWAEYYKEKYAATLERERVLLEHISKIAKALMIGVEDGEYYIAREPEPIICGASIVDACKAFKEFGDKMALQDGHRIAALEAENASLKEQLAEARKVMTAAGHALRSYQYGNSSTELAEEMADAIDAATAPPQEASRG